MWMDNSTLCANSVSEGNSCASCLYNSEEHREKKQCTSSCMIETAKSILLEVLDASPIGEKEDSTAQETGNFPAGIMHDIDPQGQSSGLVVTSDEDKSVNSKEIGTCQEFSQSVSIDAKVQKGLRKCATFPCSAEVQRKEGLPSTAVESQNPSTIGNSYARSISLPASFKLVSALKGGRAQNGINPSETLYVKWAPEVHDPPTTSMSHTVKNHHHYRSKSKKKDKHKNSKGKLSRGGGNEKKNVNKKSIANIPEPLNTRSVKARGNVVQLNGYARVDGEVFAVNGQEAKCSTSSFLKEGLAKLHLSIGEAS